MLRFGLATMLNWKFNRLSCIILAIEAVQRDGQLDYAPKAYIPEKRSVNPGEANRSYLFCEKFSSSNRNTYM